MADRTPDPDRLLSLKEVAEQIGFTDQAVRNWIRAGKLPAVKIQRNYRVKQSDLDRILEAGATTDSAASAEFWEDPEAQSFQPPVRRS